MGGVGGLNVTVIAENFVRVKISYSSICRLSYAINFRTATVVSDTLVYMYGFCLPLNFVLSANCTEYTKFKSRTKICAITVFKPLQCFVVLIDFRFIA